MQLTSQSGVLSTSWVHTACLGKCFKQKTSLQVFIRHYEKGNVSIVIAAIYEWKAEYMSTLH